MTKDSGLTFSSDLQEYVYGRKTSGSKTDHVLENHSVILSVWTKNSSASWHMNNNRMVVKSLDKSHWLRM